MDRERMKVLVYGANGAQGGAVVRRLLEAGHSVRGIPRRADAGGSGVEMVRGDMGDIESLKRASEEVDAVFLVTPALHYAEEGFEYGRNAIDAAKAAGVGHFVFNASTPTPTSSSPTWRACWSTCPWSSRRWQRGSGSKTGRSTPKRCRDPKRATGARRRREAWAHSRPSCKS